MEHRADTPNQKIPGTAASWKIPVGIQSSHRKEVESRVSFSPPFDLDTWNCRHCFCNADLQNPRVWGHYHTASYRIHIPKCCSFKDSFHGSFATSYPFTSGALVVISKPNQCNDMSHIFHLLQQKGNTVNQYVHIFLLSLLSLASWLPLLCSLPVVPHKAVAEVSKIGNL